MIEYTLLIFWGIWLALILVAACRVLFFLFLRRQQDKLWGDGRTNQQPVAVIVAAKGFDLQATPRFFDSIFAQNYSNYRVIVCFESWNDPVAQWLAEHLEVGPRNPVWHYPGPKNGLRSVTLVCSGAAEFEGQKVHNQIAAFKDLTGADAIIAFADADIVCGSDWLPKLAAPINQGTHPLSTTYRWLIPKRPSLPNQLASVINGSIATQGGSELTNVLWGGSMALSRQVFDELDLPTLLAGSLNDDLRLSKAARQQGHRIAFVRSLILPTLIDFSWGGFFEFAKRQYTQVKFFSPILYTGTNIVIGFYAVGAITIMTALIYGYFYAWIPIAAAYVIDQFRSLARQQVYLSLFSENGVRQKLFSASWLEHMMTPFWMILHWGLLVSTWTQDRITWAGIRYQIISKSETKVLFRPTATQTLPAGVPGPAMLAALLDRKRMASTQPIRPIATETPLEVTFTASEISVSEVTTSEASIAGTGASILTRADQSVDRPTSPSETLAASSALPEESTTVTSHPGAPSESLPLTATFPEGSPGPGGLPTSPERGILPAVISVLSKSRVISPILYRVPSNSTSSESTRETNPSDLPLIPPFLPVLFIQELTLNKVHRGEGARHSNSLHRLSPRGLFQSNAELLKTKTRVQKTLLHRTPASGLRATGLEAAGTTQQSAVSQTALNVPITFHQRESKSVISRADSQSQSHAARRPALGGGGIHGIPGTLPALSSRVSQSSRASAGPLASRPGTRRASGRH